MTLTQAQRDAAWITWNQYLASGGSPAPVNAWESVRNPVYEPATAAAFGMDVYGNPLPQVQQPAQLRATPTITRREYFINPGGVQSERVWFSDNTYSENPLPPGTTIPALSGLSGVSVVPAVSSQNPLLAEPTLSGANIDALGYVGYQTYQGYKFGVKPSGDLVRLDVQFANPSGVPTEWLSNPTGYVEYLTSQNKINLLKYNEAMEARASVLDTGYSLDILDVPGGGHLANGKYYAPGEMTAASLGRIEVTLDTFGTFSPLSNNNEFFAQQDQVAAAVGSIGGGPSTMDLQIETMAGGLLGLFGIGSGSAVRTGGSNLGVNFDRAVQQAFTNSFDGLISAGQSFFSEIPVLSSFYGAGQYVGTEIRINDEITSMNQNISTFDARWSSLIRDNTFTGTESQFLQYQDEYGNLIAQENQIGVLQGRQSDLQKQLFGNRIDEWNISIPSTSIEFKPVQSLFGVSNWWEQNIVKPYSDYVVPRLSTPEADRLSQSMKQNPFVPAIIFSPENLKIGGPTFIASPGKFAEFFGQAIGGSEVLLSNPGAIPAAAALGLSMQARGAYQGITERPLEFIYENMAFLALFEGATMGIKFISPIDVGRVRVPTGEIAKEYNPATWKMDQIPVTTTTYGLIAKNPFSNIVVRPSNALKFENPFTQLDWGGSRSLMGAVRSPEGLRWFFGSPEKAYRGIQIGEGWLPTTRVESALIRPVMESGLKSNPLFLETYRANIRAAELSMKGLVNVEPVENWGTIKPKALTWKTWGEVLDYTLKNREDIVPYGSTTQSVFVPSRKTLGDIDMDIRPARAEVHAQALYDLVKKDIPDIGDLKYEKSQLTEGRYTARSPTQGIILDLHPFWRKEWDVPGKLPETDGVRIMPLSETIGGKIYFSTVYRELPMIKTGGKRISILDYGEGRFKDPADISIIFGGLARRKISEPVSWDFMRVRTGKNMQLAGELADISRTYERYTFDFVGKENPEAIQYLQEAGFPSRGIRVPDPFSRSVRPKYDIKLGFGTEFVEVGTKEFGDLASPEAMDYFFGRKKRGTSVKYPEYIRLQSPSEYSRVFGISPRRMESPLFLRFPSPSGLFKEPTWASAEFLQVNLSQSQKYRGYSSLDKQIKISPIKYSANVRNSRYFRYLPAVNSRASPGRGMSLSPAGYREYIQNPSVVKYPDYGINFQYPGYSVPYGYPENHYPSFPGYPTLGYPNSKYPPYKPLKTPKYSSRNFTGYNKPVGMNYPERTISPSYPTLNRQTAPYREMTTVQVVKYPAITTVTKYPTGIPTPKYPTVSRYNAPLKTPRIETLVKPTEWEFFPWPTKRILVPYEETPPKTPQLRLHFDVVASKWNIKNPVPTIESVFGSGKPYFPRDDVRIFNKQISKSTYRKSMHPFPGVFEELKIKRSGRPPYTIASRAAWSIEPDTGKMNLRRFFS